MIYELNSLIARYTCELLSSSQISKRIHNSMMGLLLFVPLDRIMISLFSIKEDYENLYLYDKGVGMAC